MKFRTHLLLAVLFHLSAVFVFAGGPVLEGQAPAEVLWDASRSDSHAPIGVMFDHTHETGEWMLSYRYMYMHMDGHRAGEDSLSSDEVFARGFNVATLEMDMQMHMLGLMYAPCEFVTLVAMTNYQEREMELLAFQGTGPGGSGREFGHRWEGWGDASFGGLFKFYDRDRQRAHLGLVLSAPTGEELERDENNGMVLPYGMQLGSGTWDLKPSVTYLHQLGDRLSYGVQVGGTIRLEDENDAGYAFGDRLDATTWVSVLACDWASLSGRVNYIHEEGVDGQYDVPHPRMAPPHFGENYGGDTLELGVGLNLQAPASVGLLAGHRIAVEALFPVYQDLDGVGMERDWSIVVGWQKSF